MEISVTNPLLLYRDITSFIKNNNFNNK